MWPTGRSDLPESTVLQSCATGNGVSLNLPQVPNVTMGEFDGKVALVTGAGSGIGRASAQVFARNGAQVSLPTSWLMRPRRQRR